MTAPTPTPTPEPDRPTIRPAGTAYTILETDEQGSAFKYLGKITATSGEAAARKYAEQNNASGVLAAIPDRNFTMVKVTQVVTTSVKVEEL
jgi:hypothetical protein